MTKKCTSCSRYYSPEAFKHDGKDTHNNDLEIIQLKDLAEYVAELIDNYESNTELIFIVQVDIGIDIQLTKILKKEMAMLG
ncbi:6431_t:CDS:2, partial [Gigaspora rosea]